MLDASRLLHAPNLYAKIFFHQGFYSYLRARPFSFGPFGLCFSGQFFRDFRQVFVLFAYFGFLGACSQRQGTIR